jgi:hypothetical protein
MYGWETWSLTLRDTDRLGMFENRVLRIIYETPEEEATERWRKLHSEVLHTFFNPHQILLGRSNQGE